MVGASAWVIVACGTAVVGADAGVADAGGSDAGAYADDAGDDDAGTDAGVPDGGLALAPMDPACANRQGGEDCWKEWLKEERAPEFVPVARGERGAGPWPTDGARSWGAAEGLSEAIVGVGVDTGQGVYAVSRSALYALPPGAARFSRFARGTNGLRDYGLLSVAGGAPGVAYVGFEGVFGVDPDNEPEDVRRSGDVQELRASAAGLAATTWDTHNSNTPLSGKYDHSRNIFEIVVPRRGPAAGEVYLGTEHGVVRYRAPGLYADHRHVATVVGGSQRFGRTGALAVADDGTLWYGNEFAYGGLAWTPRLAEWYLDAEWIQPGQAFGPADDRDAYEGAGFAANGDVWIVARGKGLARVTARGRVETLALPDAMVRDLVVDLDDSLWVAADGGLYRGTADGTGWSRVPSVEGPVHDLFLDDTVEPRTVWVAHRRGVTALRGP
jgi:hypothetical protein